MPLILANGETIDVAANDFIAQFDWTTASLMCQGLGEGWRLPTIYEIQQIFAHNVVFGFANYGYWAYWTCEEINEEQAFGFSGDEGIIIEELKTERFYIRAVKTIS